MYMYNYSTYKKSHFRVKINISLKLRITFVQTFNSNINISSTKLKGFKYITLKS